MFPEANKQNYFQAGTETPAKGSMTTAPDYTNKIAAPTFKADIDFAAEAGTPDANRSFITQILTESGALPEMAPKVNGSANGGMKKSGKKSY